MNLSLVTNALNVDFNSMVNKHAWFLSDLENIPKKNIKVFSTFACGGGSTMGYKLAGCDVIGANDIDPEMVYHYKLNHNPKYYYLCPIRDLLKKDLPQDFFELDILDGSPPCSSFSMAGNREKDWGKKKHFREGQAKQVLDDLFFDFLDLGEKLKPKVIIAENVKGLIQGNAKWYVKLVFDRFKQIGYKPQLFLINAANCGVPQKRERVFFCALREDIAKEKLIISPKHRWVSVGASTNDLQDLTDDEVRDTAPSRTDIKFWALTIPGHSYSEAAIKTSGKASFFSHQKLEKEIPSQTLTANVATFVHWEKCRRLTFREWKRLGSFPDDYQAKTDKIGKYMIGMSVPPKMMYEVAKAVIKQWL